MAALECLALHRGGRSADAIAEIRRIWGGMLKREATTFFEAYREGETEAETLAFYGRPYGRSLCHAWSSAPVALLPMIESAYNPVALSSARAAGIWQFIPSTGKHYGLQQNFWMDSRRDVIAATAM